MIRVPKNCRTCGHVFADPIDWIGHSSKPCSKPPKVTSCQDDIGRPGFQSIERVYNWAGHRSFVDARNGRFTRSQRIAIYADNYRRDDRGRIVRPMPNMKGHAILHGQTKLDQAGLAECLLWEMSHKKPEPAVRFGAGVWS